MNNLILIGLNFWYGLQGTNMERDMFKTFAKAVEAALHEFNGKNP